MCRRFPNQIYNSLPHFILISLMDLFQRIIEQLAEEIEDIIHSNGLWALNNLNPLQKSIWVQVLDLLLKKSYKSFKSSFKPNISIKQML